MTAKPTSRNWWKAGIVYQVWPTSFKDSNAIGVAGTGDLRGVIEKVPYLQSLGINILWMSPMYDSPQKDFGYDISDYTKVWPTFGTNEDMYELTRVCHEAGIKVILDLVLNHTSDEHVWFKESKLRRDGPRADWYIWKDARYIDGKRTPPNNWRSIFEGSVWEWCEEREQYYFHLFNPAQPDLNWECAEVRRAMYKDAIEFWMDRGIDGFRVDAVNLLSKDQTFQDAEITEPDVFDQRCEKYFQNGPRMHEWLREMHREAVDKYGDVMLVGELANSDAEKTLEYVSPESKELSMVFDCAVVDIERSEKPLWELGKPALSKIKLGVQKQQDFLKQAWTTVFLENHDQPRSINRFLTDDVAYHQKAAKLLAILCGSLSGTLFIYQGQEIGMTNIPGWWDESHLRDPGDLNKLREIEKNFPGDKSRYDQVLDGIRKMGRDNARTPVQWTGGPNAGFSKSKPWMDPQGNQDQINVQDQESRPDSVLSLWKKILQLRKEYEDVLVFGEFQVVNPTDEKVFMYTKEFPGAKTAFVVINWTQDEQLLTIPERLGNMITKLLISNVDGNALSESVLSPFEARIYV